MIRKSVQFLAVIATALALMPAGAHVFELPNKIDLAEDQYFLVQTIYRGWALFGIVLMVQIAAILGAAVAVRRERAPFLLALVALACALGVLAIFFAWTYPANVATNNWTEIPDNWEALRRQWEYSHAAAAAVQFTGLCALVLSVLLTQGRDVPASRLPEKAAADSR